MWGHVCTLLPCQGRRAVHIQQCVDFEQLCCHWWSGWWLPSPPYWGDWADQPTKPTICYHHTKPQCTKNTQPLCTSVYAYYAGALLVKPNDSKPTDTNGEGRPKQSAMQTILGSGVWGRGSKRASKRPTPLIQPSFPPLPQSPQSSCLLPIIPIANDHCDDVFFLGSTANYVGKVWPLIIFFGGA